MKRRQKRQRSQAGNRDRDSTLNQRRRTDGIALWQSFVKCICVPFVYIRQKLQNVNIRPVSGNSRPQRNVRSGAYTVNQITEPETTDALLLRSEPLHENTYANVRICGPKTTGVVPGPSKSVDSNVDADTPPSSPLKIPNCYILVLGLAGSGKTTTISKLLNTELSSTADFLEIRQQSPAVSLNLIEAPGFGRGQSAQEDAEIILALKNHTTALYPNRIPSIVFVVSRFDDNRFEGESSEFSKMLRALSHSKQHWTDARHSNVILLLTNSAKVSRDSEDIDFKISRFQNTFYEFFPEGFPVPVALVENFNDPKSQSRILDSISLLRQDRNISNFIQSVKYDNLEDIGEAISTPISSLLPSNTGELYTIMDQIQQSNTIVEAVNVIKNTEQNFQPWFVPAFPESLTFPLSRTFGQEFVSVLAAGTKIILFDRTEIRVEDLVIGHRLLNKDMESSVIISIQRLKPSDELYHRQLLGKIYCRQRNGLGDEELSSSENEIQIIYKYLNKKIRLGTIDRKAAECVRDSTLYTLELDKHDSTFIADNHVLYFNHTHALQSRSHTSL